MTEVSLDAFVFLGGVCALVGLAFTAVSLRDEAHTRRISNLIALTEGHRELWQMFIERGDLQRILLPRPDLHASPLMIQEERFVLLLIVHLQTAYRAIGDNLVIKPAAIRRDVWWFLSLPIPAEVWKRYRTFHDPDFVQFVEDCLK